MTIDIRPWKRLLPVWLPTMAVCLGAAFFFAWQTSDSGGRRSQVQDRVAELESELTRIEGLLRAAEGDRDSVAELESQFSELNDSVFGTLDGRCREESIETPDRR